MNRNIMNVEEVAAYMGVSKDLIYGMVRRGEIPHNRISTRILFQRTSIEKWLQDKEIF